MLRLGDMVFIVWLHGTWHVRYFWSLETAVEFCALLVEFWWHIYLLVRLFKQTFFFGIVYSARKILLKEFDGRGGKQHFISALTWWELLKLSF